jgi:hypothetical protein
MTASTELAKLRDHALTALTLNFDRAQIALDHVRRLKGNLTSQLTGLCVSLHDERLLLRPQFEALIAFAAHNHISTEELVSRITICDGQVVGANFNSCELTDLGGLDKLWSLKQLYVSNNPRLTSLAGIPRTVEELSATRCGLRGDLSDLAAITALKRLYIYENKGITSLNGVPLDTIEEIYAADCQLHGDLSEIARAERLRMLHILHNRGITSLKGIPLKNIEHIHANGCGLTGDHTFLSCAANLQTLILLNNKDSLTLDASLFGDATKVFL